MLLWLADHYARDLRALNVIGYITLRAVFGCMTALVISFVVGPRMIAWLTRMKIGQAVRDDGPQTHLTKAGTPTMGGALIIVSILVTTLLWGELTNRFVWVVLIVTAGFGAVGWIDDYRKVVYRNPRGLSARGDSATAKPELAQSPKSRQNCALPGAEIENARYVAATRPISDSAPNLARADRPRGLR